MILMPSYSTKRRVLMIRNKMESLRKEKGLSFCLSSTSPKIGIHGLLLVKNMEVGIFNDLEATLEANTSLHILNQESYSFIGISFKEWLKEYKTTLEKDIKDCLYCLILGEIKLLFNYFRDWDFDVVHAKMYSQENWDKYILRNYFYRKYSFVNAKDVALFLARRYFEKDYVLHEIESSYEFQNLIRFYADRILNGEYSYGVCCDATENKEVVIKDFIPFAVYKENTLWLSQSVSQSSENDGDSMMFSYKKDDDIARVLQDEWYSLLPIQDEEEYRVVTVNMDGKDSVIYDS